MQNKSLILIAVVLGIIAVGLVTAVVYTKYIKGSTPPAPPPVAAPVDTRPVAPPTYPVLLAKQPIPRGTLVKPEMVYVRRDTAPTPAGALTSPDTLRAKEFVTLQEIDSGAAVMTAALREGMIQAIALKMDVPPNTIITNDLLEVALFEEAPAAYIDWARRNDFLRKVTRTGLRAGHLLTISDLFAQGPAQLSYLIPIYKRAITMPAKAPDLVNNFMIKQGDIVDVIARFEEHYAGVDVTRTIVQTAEVLALNQAIDRSDTNAAFAFITLAVTPREAEKLTFAGKHASEVRFVLRSPVQRTVRDAENATTETLLGHGVRQTVEVFNGAVSTTQEVREW